MLTLCSIYSSGSYVPSVNGCGCGSGYWSVKGSMGSGEW